MFRSPILRSNPSGVPLIKSLRLRAGQAIAPSDRGGKSELRTGGMPGNPRSRRREGKCHREQTAFPARGAGTARVKRCGKSAPPRRQRRGHGKPHAEQGQIGGQRAPVPFRLRGLSPGRLLERAGDRAPRGMIAPGQPGQNSAYRPARSFSAQAVPSGPAPRVSSSSSPRDLAGSQLALPLKIRRT
jgi:hypothetical protein